MNEKEKIDWLSKELAKRDWESLCRKVACMTFQQAYKKLGGYNLESDGYRVNLFDVNYKSITASIHCTAFSGCYVSNKVDLWLPNDTTPLSIEIERE
jgi:hypothetical protein